MSGWVIGGIVVAVVLVALALQVLARVIHGLPLDQRRADPLVDVSSRVAGSMRPAELHHLTTLVANSVLSDASYRSELTPLLDQLTEAAPNRGEAAAEGGQAGEAGGSPGRTHDGGRRRPGGRNRRSDRLELAVADLERRWGLGADRSRSQSKG